VPVSDAPSLRETLESAMTASEEAAPEVVEAPAVEAAPEAPAEAPTETPAEAAARARDGKGRFAPKNEEAKPAAKAAPKAAAPAPKPEAAAPAAPVAPKPEAPAPEAAPVKAPQSFRPAVRELAAKLPAEFRPILEESVRIDNEAKRALNDSAQARQLATQVQQSLAPYAGIAQANGQDPMTWAGNALQLVAGLYQGTPQHKAQLIAKAIATSGASLDDISAALSGVAPTASGAPAQAPQDVSKLVEQEFQRRTQEAQNVKAQRDWEAFTSSAPEFLADVTDDMREILELAGRQGRNMTYQQAYDRACKLNEDVSAILAQRKSAEAVRAQAPAVQRAKVAASSIKAAPVAATTRPTGSRSLRETIEDAVAASQRT
jgi:hypothetical protein